MDQKQVYKSYPIESKEETVALVIGQDYTVSEGAKSLGIRVNKLYDWKAKIEASKQGCQLRIYNIALAPACASLLYPYYLAFT